MAATAILARPTPSALALGSSAGPVIRVAIIVPWSSSGKLASASGLFYRDVIPSLLAIGRALLAAVWPARTSTGISA